MDNLIHTPECFASYMGLWCIEAKWFRSAVAAVKAGMRPPANAAAGKSSDSALYQLTGDGIAVISLAGPMMKAESKFGGTSTLTTRRAIRQAVSDGDVRGIMLAVDSPGGTVSGTSDLADDIRKAGKSKPLYAHADDMMASAAYWAASGAQRLTASRTTQVGSIGVMAVVEDSSHAAEMEGVKVHVVTSDGAEAKGDFADGTPVTDEQIAELRTELNAIADHFVQAISKSGGGRLSASDARKVADGRIHMAADAKAMGLIDDVMSFDDAMTALRRDISQRDREARQRTRMAELRLRGVE